MSNLLPREGAILAYAALMRTGRARALALLAPLLSACAPKSFSASTIPALRASEVIAHHIEAIGGEEKLRRIHSIQEIGILNERGTLHPLFIDRERPNHLRVRMMHDGQLVFSEVYDGSRNWEGGPGKENCSPDSGATAATRHAAEQFDDPLITVTAIAKTVDAVAVDQVDGRPMYRLDITAADRGMGSYFIDARTFLLDRVRTRRPLHPTEPTRTIELVLDDYRPVNGVLFPFRAIERDVASGEPLSVSTTEWIETNVPIADNPYARPAACR